MKILFWNLGGFTFRWPLTVVASFLSTSSPTPPLLTTRPEKCTYCLFCGLVNFSKVVACFRSDLQILMKYIFYQSFNQILGIATNRTKRCRQISNCLKFWQYLDFNFNWINNLNEIINCLTWSSYPMTQRLIF